MEHHEQGAACTFDLREALSAHAVQLAEWSQAPENADAAMTLLVMAQHCNAAAAELGSLQSEIKRLHAAATKAIERAAIFDDGSDGADSESAQSVVAILSATLTPED